MPIQAPQWTEFLCCPVCCNEFDGDGRGPISLGCGHTLCRGCLASMHRHHCPFDQTHIRLDTVKVPLNSALLRLVGITPVEAEVDTSLLPSRNAPQYRRAVQCIDDLAMYLPHFSTGTFSVLSRPMQRKLVTLVNCQLLEAEGRARALRAARSLGERTVTELLLHHQNPQQLSANLWAAVRARGCQFLGPAMQEEVLKLVLLALEDGSALSRKVLVMFVVQRLEPHYTQASKTSIGHVVQLLYRASCFKVSKREGDSSLMQLKEEFRSYEALRREHDAQIVQIATEAGLRIAPDQWSSLLYGDTAHKSHMQSIMDKLQTPQSFSQSIQELIMALQRTGDPGGLGQLRGHLELLAGIDPSPEVVSLTWQQSADAVEAARAVVAALAEFVTVHANRRAAGDSAQQRFKMGLCREMGTRGVCARGAVCSFAHSEAELERYRARVRKAEGGTTTTGLPMYEMPPTYFPPPPPAYPPNNAGYLWYLEKERLYGRNGNAVMLTGSSSDPVDPNNVGSIMNRSGTSYPEVQNLAYEASMREPVLNMNVTGGLWHASPHRVSVAAGSLPQDPHFYLQPPVTLDSQRLDHDLLSLENHIVDIHISDTSPDSGKIIQTSDTDHNVSAFEDSLQEEELYEAGIAEDMRVLEERWECELAEQERRWSESHS